MAEAARSARTSFNEIKSGSTEMGTHLSGNMFASRHAIMAVSESLGVQMPRAITALLVHIGPLGAALEAAFPFAAIALGAVLLIEKLAGMKEAGIKLSEDQVKFGTTVQTVFNGLEQKLVQAAIKSDELRQDHLGALAHQLQLIDMQSMDELVQAFTTVAKGADVVFADLQSHWYSFGAGSTGAKHALDEFQTKYESLLRQGKDGEASDLLKGTRESAEKALAKLREVSVSTEAIRVLGAVPLVGPVATAVSDAKGGGRVHEIEAVETLVGALRAQETVEQRIAALKGADKGNATAQTGKELAGLAAEGARQAAEHRTKMAEIELAGEREPAQAMLTVTEATAMQRLLVEMALADKQRDIQLAGNAGLIAALDKGGKDYTNQLAGLRGKAQEIEAQHAATVSELVSKAGVEQNAKMLQDLQPSEREQIEATQQGSLARLGAIDAALKEEQAKGLQSTAFYRELLQQRVQAEREATLEASKLAAEAGKLAAEDAQKMGELRIAAERASWNLLASAQRVTLDQRVSQEVLAANQEFAVKQAAMQQEAAALDKSSKDYENKLRAIQNKEKQLTQEHENELTAIKAKAEEERNSRILSAENRFNDEIAAGLTSVLMGHKSFAAMMNSLGSQVASGMMENAIKSVLANDMTKESTAAKAARDAYASGVEIGGPAGFILGPIMGAQAFAAVMAFQEGGIVPGVGPGDIVPAMLTPGEGIIPGGVMDGLSKMAKSGGMGGGNHYHAHVKPTYNLQAIDANGVETMLNKHHDTLVRHVESTLRKMNH